MLVYCWVQHNISSISCFGAAGANGALVAITCILLACAIFGSLGGTGDSNSGAQEYGGHEPEPESEPEPEPEG